MLSLTTTQRDLLCLLLEADEPCSAAALGERLHLTPRQVQYGLREVRPWLVQRQADLRHLPGVGVQVVGSPERRRDLLAALTSQARFQLVLAPEQRQQLLALLLLAAAEPIILGQFQQELEVARATVLKDLEASEPWLRRFGLAVARRQHRGFWVEGPELARRQALAALAWGDVPFDRPLMGLANGQTLAFALAQDAALLPVVARVNALVAGWDLALALECVALAEAELGGRFAEEAVSVLALELAIQRQRVAAGLLVAWEPASLRRLQAQAAWGVAARLAAHLWPGLPDQALAAEAAALSLALSARPRDEPWRGDLPADPGLAAMVGRLVAVVARAYSMPELAHDQLLRDGIEAHLLPAGLRRHFGLWAPPRGPAELPAEADAVERRVVAQVAAELEAATGLALPPDAEGELLLLLRAALVRARPERPRHILVVCPSGMATTQLLVARLRARMPRLGTFEVLPMRALTPERVATADLIISTVPLVQAAELPVEVIQVHPALRSEDIAALMHWMA
ncbi:MAG TPA: hypothetical protein PKD53_19015 [Chloroflexaceae bacterium]|nr:hypothetical protein [Chloroflexaceae bacterium]